MDQYYIKMVALKKTLINQGTNAYLLSTLMKIIAIKEIKVMKNDNYLVTSAHSISKCYLFITASD